MMKLGYYILSVMLMLSACTLSQGANKVLEWKFDGNLNDTSGNGVNGDPCGTITYDTGVSNQCFVSDGYSNTHKMGVAPGILPVHKTDKWSVNVWVNPTTTIQDWGIVWCLGVQPAGIETRGKTRSMYGPASGNITFTDGGDPNALFISTGVPFDIDQWQMITTTYDGRKVRFYKDGLLIGSRIYDTNFVNCPNDLRVPTKYDGTSKPSYFIGKIDEFTMWDGVLTQQEILDLIPPGVIPEVNLIEEMVYYTMDDAVSGVMPDHSGKFNDGMLANSTVVTVPGVKGQALKFDYNPVPGQAIAIPSFSIGKYGQYSLAFWLKASWETYQSAYYFEKPASGNTILAFRPDEEGYVKLYARDNSKSEYTIGRFDARTYLSGGVWHHWAFTADGNELRLYIDGQVKTSIDYEDANPKNEVDYSYIGYNPESKGYLGWYNPAYMDEVHLYRGALTQDQVQVLMLEDNFDCDTDIYLDDFAVMADDWLENTISVPGTTYVIDDMEGSVAGWQVHHSTKYSGTGTTSLTSNAYEGNGALQWDYSLPLPMYQPGNGNYTSIYYDLGQTIDFSSYDKMQLRLNRHPGNSGENLLFLKFYKYTTDIGDSNAIKAEAWIARSDSTSVPSGEWELWDINLDTLVGKGGVGLKTSDDLTDVRFIMIGCGSEGIATARQGTIDIDEMKMIRFAVCTTPLLTDLNDDCTVNFSDFAILADDWLLGIE
jgi:hypothetical protein